MVCKNFSLTKRSALIRIEPYEKLVDDAVGLVEDVMGGGFFSGVDEIVVDPAGVDHYGMVNSEEMKKIYIAGGRIKSEFPSDRISQVIYVAETLAHEIGHIRDGLRGGEAPAEILEREFRSKLAEKLKNDPGFLAVYKQASLSGSLSCEGICKLASMELTSVSDPLTGKKIGVTTTARIYFRQANPTWGKVKNEFLSEAIAKMFASTKLLGTFVPKKGPSTAGYIRGTPSSKFIAVEISGAVVVVAVKGQHSLSAPAPISFTSPVPVDFGNKSASIDDDLKAHRGWLENHFFDIFIGQYAFDANTEELLREYAITKGVKGIARLDRDSLSQLAQVLLGEDQRGFLVRAPAVPGNLGLLNIPVGYE